MIIKAYKNNKEFDLKLLGTRGYKFSGIRVDYSCDICRSIKNVDYKSLLRYGFIDRQICRSCTIKTKGSIEKRKKTCIKKYGTDNPMKVPELSRKRVTEDIAQKQRTDFNIIKESFEKEKYILLTKSYKNRTQKLKYICPEGHNGTITWSSWNTNSCRCKKCGNIRSTEKKRYNIESVREILKLENYELLSEAYINKYIPIKYKCPKGHIGFISFGNWLHNDTRCSSCSHIISNSEIELYNIIKEYFLETIHNDREIIKPLELDIVIPSKKLAIEYCGIYWHSELKGKDRNYHINKLNKCNETGYDLITVFEDEWVNRKEVVISRLLHKLGVSESKKIYARKCNIKEISAKEAREFCDIHHLQGYYNSNINIGAFYKDKLVSVMCFSKSSISKGGKSGTELTRFCSDYNYNIIGIAGKLFKFFIRNYEYTIIVSYGDKRWSKGNIYKVLGFKFEHESPSNYWYIIGSNRLHRFNFRKNILHKKLSNFNPEISEWENMKVNGYDRIWDCGNIKWIYTKTTIDKIANMCYNAYI